MKASYVISGVLLCATLGLAPTAVACDGHSKGAVPKAESTKVETTKVADNCCESKASATEDCCKDGAKADCCEGSDKKAAQPAAKTIADSASDEVTTVKVDSDKDTAAGDATETKTEATGTDSDSKAADTKQDADGAGASAATGKSESKSEGAAGSAGKTE